MNWIKRSFRLTCAIATIIYRTITVLIKMKFADNPKDIFSKEMKIWAKNTLKHLKINVQVQGCENISENETYIYIANHTNLIDIPILVEAIPDNIHFMYKQSLQKVPVLGTALKASPFVPIVRENNKNAMNGINKSIEALQNTGSVIVFPEGTRSKTGELATFKRGAFAIASKSNKKIVPISIKGVEKIMPPNNNWRINKGTVRVIINKPIEKLPEERNEQIRIINEIHSLIEQQLKS